MPLYEVDIPFSKAPRISGETQISFFPQETSTGPFLRLSLSVLGRHHRHTPNDNVRLAPVRTSPGSAIPTTICLRARGVVVCVRVWPSSSVVS